MATLDALRKIALGSAHHVANFLGVDPQGAEPDITRGAPASLDPAQQDLVQKLPHRDARALGALRQRRPFGGQGSTFPGPDHGAWWLYPGHFWVEINSMPDLDQIFNNNLIRLDFLRKSQRAGISGQWQRQTWRIRADEPPIPAQPHGSHPPSDRCESDRLAGYHESKRGGNCAVFRRNTRVVDPPIRNPRRSDSLLAMRHAHDLARCVKRAAGRIGE